MAKIVTYKGKTDEELKALSLEDFSKLLPSRQRRSLLRGFTEQQKKLLERLRKKEGVRTHVRDMVILPEMIGKIIGVHNGKSFVDV